MRMACICLVLAMSAMIATGVAWTREGAAAGAAQTQALDTEALTQLRDEVRLLRQEVAGLRVEIAAMREKRFVYCEATINRLKSRSVAELLNKMGDDGWEYVNVIGNETYLFRKVAEPKR